MSNEMKDWLAERETDKKLLVEAVRKILKGNNSVTLDAPTIIKLINLAINSNCDKLKISDLK